MFTQADLQELLSFEGNGSRVVSLYLNADIAEDSSEAIKLRAKNLLKSLNGRFAPDASAIEKYLEYSHDWSKPGLAIFSCSERNFWRVFPTAVPFRNRVRVKAKPHVKPIAHLLDFYAHYGVILVDRVGARFFEYHLGELQATEGHLGENVRTLKDGQGSSAHGMRGGLEGSRRESEVIQRNLREVAAAAGAFFSGRKIRRLFLAGTPETVGQLRDLLPRQLASCLAGQFQIDMDAPEGDVRQKSLALLHEANARREEDLVHRLVEESERGGLVVTGLDDTLRAIFTGRVQTLVITDGFRQTGYRYGETGFLSSKMVIDRPEAAGQPETVEDIVEEAVTLTLASGGHVELISDNPDMAQIQHIGAFLRD